MSRNVYLPKELDSRLTNLTELDFTTSGILLYTQSQNICVVDALIVTGTGKKGQVQTLAERIRVASEFLKTNTTYKSIEFNTCHLCTKLDNDADYTRFIDQYKESITQKLKHDNNIMALIATQYKKLLLGTDNPELVIFPNHMESIQTIQKIDWKLINIATALGYKEYSLENRQWKIAS